jgi:exonuclease III
MQETANEVLANNIDITALQKIRCDGSGRVDKKRYAMFYRGTQTKTGQYGTGFIVTRKMKNNILPFEPRNERVSKLRKKGKFRNITLITVHAPTKGKEEQEKEEFYDRLEEVCGKIQKYV